MSNRFIVFVGLCFASPDAVSAALRLIGCGGDVYLLQVSKYIAN